MWCIAALLRHVDAMDLMWSLLSLLWWFSVCLVIMGVESAPGILSGHSNSCSQKGGSMHSCCAGKPADLHHKHTPAWESNLILAPRRTLACGSALNLQPQPLARP